MKIKLYQLTLFITALFIFGCTSSDDGFDSESSSVNEMSAPDYQKIYDMRYLGNAKLNDDNLFKGVNNGNGAISVAFYSNTGLWWAVFPIFDKDGNQTHDLWVDFPQNGEDRALVFSETEMMVNFNSHGPRMFLVEFGVGITHSNHCDEDRNGTYKGRVKTTYNGYDLSEPSDGIIDLYHWGPNALGTVMDKNFIFHIKSTLTDAHSFDPDLCPDPTESIEFSYTFQSANGKIRQTSSLH